MSTLTVITLGRPYLDEVARVHIAAFPHSFLSKMGAATLVRYYDWQFSGPHTVVAHGVELEDRLAGFCFSGRFNAAMLGFLRHNFGPLAKELILRPEIMCTRLFVGRLFSGAYLFLRPRGEAAGRQDNPYRILSLAVHPDFQGRGIGHALLDSAESLARSTGVASISLRVDPLNQAAISLYQKHGWTALAEEGRWQGLMVRRLSQYSDEALWQAGGGLISHRWENHAHG